MSILILAELTVRLYCWATETPLPIADKSLKNEWEWIQKHRDNDQDPAENSLLSFQYQYDPDVGWFNKANVVSDRGSTNSVGMRTRQEFSYQPEIGKKRILFLGASYIDGAFVQDEEMFSAVLAKQHLPDWDVINLAVSATGTDQQLLMFEKFGRRYQPNIVVMGFQVRNYFTNLLTFSSYSKPKFIIENDTLRLINTPVIAPQALYAEYQSG